MRNFKDLKVWQIAMDLSVKIYHFTQAEGPIKKDFGLKDQLQRSSVSVPSNIAEGETRSSLSQRLNFFNYATASLAELHTQIIISYRVGYLSEELYQELDRDCIDLSVRLQNFINYRKKNG